jgi:uncharacterized double-CXXCG motif protein
MTRYFHLREDEAAWKRYRGDFDAAHKWILPGAICPTCGVTWGGTGHDYPAVDLSHLPERAEFEKARAEPFHEFARLRELVRPLAPPHAELPPARTLARWWARPREGLAPSPSKVTTC